MGWLYYSAFLWERVPVFTRAVYIAWIIYGVFYFVILRYEKEHKLVRARQLAKLNLAYSFYVVLGLVIISDRFFSFAVISDSETYQNLAAFGYTLMAGGLWMVISGRITLNGFWGAGIFTYDPNNKDFVQTGLYRWVRHPVYFGQLLLAVGMAAVMNNWIVWLLPILSTIFNVKRAAAEEADLLVRVGEPYATYKNRTSFIVPWTW